MIRHLMDGSTLVLRHDGSSSLRPSSSPSIVIHTHTDGSRTSVPVHGSSFPPPPSSSNESPESLTHEDNEDASTIADVTEAAVSLPFLHHHDSGTSVGHEKGLSPLPCRTGVDPSTGAKVTVLGEAGQEGHVVVVVYRGGESWTRHDDGTSFRTLGQRRLIDGPTG